MTVATTSLPETTGLDIGSWVQLTLFESEVYKHPASEERFLVIATRDGDRPDRKLIDTSGKVYTLYISPGLRVLALEAVAQGPVASITFHDREVVHEVVASDKLLHIYSEAQKACEHLSSYPLSHKWTVLDQWEINQNGAQQ